MKKYSVVLVGLLVMISCKNKKGPAGDPIDFDTESVHLDQDNLETCKDTSCPGIAVDYVKIKNDSTFGRHINKANREDLISIFKSAATDTTVDLKTIEDGIDNFIDDYFTLREKDTASLDSYEATVEQEIKSRNKHTVVLKTSFYISTENGHDYDGVHFLNFDAHSGKLLHLDDLLSDKKGFTDFMEEKFRLEREIPQQADINARGDFFDDDEFALPGQIAVTEDQVILIYNPYETGNYEEGQIRFLFPKEQVEGYFNY